MKTSNTNWQYLLIVILLAFAVIGVIVIFVYRGKVQEQEYYSIGNLDLQQNAPENAHSEGQINKEGQLKEETSTGEGLKEELSSEKSASQIIEEVYGKVNDAVFLNADTDENQEIAALLCIHPGRSLLEDGTVLIFREVIGRYELQEKTSGFHCAAERETKKLEVKDIDKDGINEVFFEDWWAGTGMKKTYTMLYALKYGELFRVEALNPFHPAATTTLTFSDNLSLEAYEVFKNFFDEITAQHFTDEKVAQDPDNPNYAEYFWVKDNGYVQEGKIKIRWYKGKPSERGSYNDTIEEGESVWYAHFKGSVIEYNKNLDSFYVIYVPWDVYNWPNSLEKKDELLFIGLRYDGVIAYKLETNTLKPVLSNKELGIRELSSMRIVDDKIVVNGIEVPLVNLEFE